MPPATSGSPMDRETDKKRQAQTLKPKNSIRRAMRGLTKNLQVRTDKVDEIPEELVSHNRTPPLEPESPIAPSTPLKDPSSHNLNTFSGTSIHQSQSRIGHLMNSLKEDWEAGIDPKYYFAKREKERQAMNGSAEPTQSRSSNGSRGLERASSNRTTTTQDVSQRRAAKAADQHKKEVRKLQREESVRKLVKNQRDVDRGYFPTSEISPKFAPLNLLQKANDARIQVQERERAQLEELDRRRNFDAWEKGREAMERRQAHAPPGFRLSPPVIDYAGKNPYELPTRTAKEFQPSGPRRSLSDFSFRNVSEHHGDLRPDSHRSRHEDPFGQPRDDISEDEEPSAKGQNTYLYYRPEPQPAADPRLPSDRQTEYPMCLSSHFEPGASNHARSPSDNDFAISRPEEFQNYRNFHTVPEIPRSSIDSWEEESLYSQTADEISTEQ